jgi:ribosomal protein L32
MAKCPACHSTRVYKGYRPAPLLLRLFLIHDFLCENCNLQFRQFSLTPPRSRRSRSKKTTTPSPSFQASEAGSAVTVQDSISPLLVPSPSAAAAGPRQPPVPPTAVTSQPPPPSPPTIQGQWQMPAEALEEYEKSRRSHRSHQVCPHCGATDTERRRRKMWEKFLFSFTTIRAYQCRICGADFYARRKKKK